MADARRLHVALGDFGAFYLTTWDDAFRLALAITRDRAAALDVAQEAYLAAYMARERFRGEGPPLHWLLRIVANKAASHGRARSRRWRLREIAGTELRGRDDVSLEDRTADRVAIENAFHSLAPQQRAAVVLRYVHGFDYASIGRILGMTPSNVGVTLSRSLARLRRALEGKGVHER